MFGMDLRVREGDSSKKGNLAPKEAERFKLGLKYRRAPRYVDWAHRRPMQEGAFLIQQLPFNVRLLNFLYFHKNS